MSKTYKKNTAMSSKELRKMFSDEETARKFLEKHRWGNIPTCPHCDSQNATVLKNRKGYYTCNGCGKQFCVKTKSIFASTKIALTDWFIAFYYLVTDRKGISSIKMSKELGITQKSAWYLEQKIRGGMSNEECQKLLEGIIELDETYIGGKEKNKHSKKKFRGGRGPVGKSIVFGMMERGEQGRVNMCVVYDKKHETFSRIIVQNVKPGSTINTDEATWYKEVDKLGYEHQIVNHSAKQYVDGMAFTNGIESVWAVLKRGFYGVYHNFSVKYLHRYVAEFQFRWNEGNCRYTTMERIDSLLAGFWGKVLPYKVLVAK
jgi:transposase-like protein